MGVILSCHKCLKLLTNPITCVPCGHHYCKSCSKGYENDTCKECKEDIDVLFKNDVLADIITKAKYREELFKAVSSKNEFSMFKK